ncbi:MAG: CapA family protein, partial [Pseudomonas sp.]|nr:CapA family protein [Pseudomonas sp.]
MNAYLMEALRQIMQQIKTTLDEHGDEITTTLQRVALGELKPVETLTPEELECARELFGWVAQHDPLKVWAKVGPLLPELIGSAADIALDEIFVDPGFGELPPSLKKLKDKRTLARLGVLLASYICYDQFHYPQPET